MTESLPSDSLQSLSARRFDRRPALRALLFAVVQAAFLGITIYTFLGGPARDFGAPLRFERDSLAYLTQTKTTLENGWWWVNPRLSAPFAFNELLFPSNSTVDQLIIVLLRPFVGGVGSAMNIAWILMLILSGITASWCFRLLGLSLPSAFVCGALFALSPFALYRNLEHFMLVTYLVPFAAAAAIAVATGTEELIRNRRDRMILVAGCALSGFNYVYNAFFGCVVLGTGIVAGYLAHRDTRHLRTGVLCITMIIAATALNLWPSLRAWSVHGKPVIIAEKLPAEAEFYGLKVRQLLSPLPEHSFRPFAAWIHRERWAGFPLETENGTARLGVVASAGFIGGLLALLGAGRARRTTESRLALAAGQLIVFGVLVATIGGLGTLFNLFVASDIRGYNRIVPFLAFYALLVVGIACDSVTRRHRTGGLAVAAGLLALGVWDSHVILLGIAYRTEAFRAEYRALETLVGQMESALPAGSRVLQLPFTIYLNDPGRARMKIYDQFKPYLVSRHLRWSFPAMADDHFRWQQAAAGLPPDALPPVMAHEGFAAILVDKYGYADNGAAAIASLSSMQGVRVAWSDERYTGLDIRHVQVDDRATAMALALHRPPPTVDAALPHCNVQAPFSFDYVGGRPGPFAAGLRVSSKRPLRVAGWIAFPEDTAAAVDLVVDDRPLPLFYGFPRPDVAGSLGNPRLQDSGFVAVIPAEQLTPGAHVIRLRALSRSGQCSSDTVPMMMDVR